MLPGALEDGGGWLAGTASGGLDGQGVGVECSAGWLDGDGDGDADGWAEVRPHRVFDRALQAADPASRLVVARPGSEPVPSRYATTSAVTAMRPALLASSTARRDRRGWGRCALWRAIRLTLVRYRANRRRVTHFAGRGGHDPWSR
jgi:hypothetical protein